MKKYDKILTLGLFILEAFYFLLIKQLPEKAAKYPYFVLGLLFALTLLLAFNSFFGKSEEDNEDNKFKDMKKGQFFLIIIVSAIYIFLIYIF